LLSLEVSCAALLFWPVVDHCCRCRPVYHRDRLFLASTCLDAAVRRQWRPAVPTLSLRIGFFLSTTYTIFHCLRQTRLLRSPLCHLPCPPITSQRTTNSWTREQHGGDENKLDIQSTHEFFVNKHSPKHSVDGAFSVSHSISFANILVFVAASSLF